MAGKNKALGGGGFHHVAVKVADFDAAVKFYTETLGFRPDISWGEGDKRAVMLDTGDGSCLEVFAGGKAGAKPEGALIHLALRTGDCDAALARARAAGAEVTMEPTDVDIAVHKRKPLPVRIAFCRGPAGEILEFFQSRK